MEQRPETGGGIAKRTHGGRNLGSLRCKLDSDSREDAPLEQGSGCRNQCALGRMRHVLCDETSSGPAQRPRSQGCCLSGRPRFLWLSGDACRGLCFLRTLTLVPERCVEHETQGRESLQLPLPISTAFLPHQALTQALPSLSGLLNSVACLQPRGEVQLEWATPARKCRIIFVHSRGAHVNDAPMNLMVVVPCGLRAKS